jgi:hypothetical protein
MKPSTPAPKPRPTLPPRRRPDTMRATLMLSLLLCPRGGVPVHRHGQGGR